MAESRSWQNQGLLSTLSVLLGLSHRQARQRNQEQQDALVHGILKGGTSRIQIGPVAVTTENAEKGVVTMSPRHSMKPLKPQMKGRGWGCRQEETGITLMGESTHKTNGISKGS